MHASTRRLGGGLAADPPTEASTPGMLRGTVVRGGPRSPAEEDDVEAAVLATAGFVRAGGTKKVILLRRSADGREVYLVRGTAKRKLVIHPDDGAEADLALRGTGGLHEGAYHNANMGRFPRRRNKGTGEVHEGLGYAFPTMDGAAAFLAALGRG